MEKEIRLSYIKKIDEVNKNGKYKPNWSSLSEYGVPEWYKKAKFGVFIHWGLFTVPQYFSEWYPRLMYYKGNPVYWHHKRKYGKNFNYRDFIELFSAQNFDAAEWVSAVKSCGARFIMPVAEHHDGFKLYNSDLNEWTSVKNGPKKDFLGAIKTECEKQNLIFSASSHRAEHFWFLNGGKTVGFQNETQDEKYREFYGACENVHKFNNLYTLLRQEHGIEPTEEWLEDWLVSSCELIDKYQPSSLFFDWWVSYKAFRPYMKKFLAYYYNRSLEWQKQVCVYYKSDAAMYNCAIFDRERGQLENISPYIWQGETSTSYNSWSYCTTNRFKTPEIIACNFLDVISKNGCFVLNIGPMADGTICSEEKNILKQLGKWTEINQEAIWETQPYKLYGEGKKQKAGSFSEHFRYTKKDYRFTYKIGTVYVFALKPDGRDRFNIKSLGISADLFNCIIKNITVLGFDIKCSWIESKKGLVIKTSKKINSTMPVCFKISLE